MAGGKFAGGSGSQLDPFLIEDAHDFNAMRLYSSGYYFQLIKDINLNTPPYNTGSGWQPIPRFTSQIDGQGHRVTGLRIWSKGGPVGLFLTTSMETKLTNIHFDDVYMELITEDTSNKKFTFFGYSESRSGTADLANGVSIVGKFKIQAPNVTARLLVYDLNGSGSHPGTFPTVNFNDCYFELENLGTTQIQVLGYSYHIGSYGSSRMNAVRTIFKCKGSFSGHTVDGGNAYAGTVSAYLVDDLDTVYTGFSGYNLRTPDFLSIPENLPEFVQASHLGRQIWVFPGTTHVRMVDYSRNKFLLEAAGKIFTYDAKIGGLVNVGVAPVIIDMFTEYGMDYVESIPVSAWNELRQTYGTVDIHCYVEKIPGKSLVTNREALVFTQALENKVVMKTTIDFSEHNNDINRIRVPAVKPVPVVTEPAPTEPTEPDTGTTEPGATVPETTEPII